MKRILPRLLAGIWAIACSALATSDPPPLEWTGWQVRVPSGEAPVLVESGDPLGLEPLSSGAMADVLSMPPANEPRGPVTLDFGLQPTLPVSTSSMIPEIARCLDYNWLFCYLFVRDNIRFTPYRGLARGPERTLIDREGNDADQASLLFALLRASGYPSSTICYSPTNTFRVRLAGGQNDYDAAHWLGIPADGTVSDLTNAIHRVLSASGVPFGFSLGASPQQSRLIIEHFYVWLNDGFLSYYIDPSFKPRRRTPPEASLLADAGYVRSNLLDELTKYQDLIIR